MSRIHLSNHPNLPVSDNIMIPISNGRFKRISISEIAYVEAARDNCIIYMHDSKKYILVCPLADFLQQISPCSILRVHRSFAVNINYIDETTYGMIFLANGMEVRIGNYYRSSLYEIFPIKGLRSRKKPEI